MTDAQDRLDQLAGAVKLTVPRLTPPDHDGRCFGCMRRVWPWQRTADELPQLPRNQKWDHYTQFHERCADAYQRGLNE